MYEYGGGVWTQTDYSDVLLYWIMGYRISSVIHSTLYIFLKAVVFIYIFVLSDNQYNVFHFL